MSRTIFDPAQCDALLQRLHRLTPGAQPRWGRFTAHGMVCHLADSLRCAGGELPVQVRGGPLANPVVRWLMAHVIPFPKARAQTAPEMLSTAPSDWDADLAAACEQLRAAAARGPDGTWAPHPAFGEMPGRLYGVFIHKHFDHHLRQFGA